MKDSVNILSIVKGTAVDGVGIRDAIYFAGCLHACDGCHNKQSWNFDAGEPISLDDILNEVYASSNKGVTFSGGDPIYSCEELIYLCSHIKEHSNKNIWIYTGFEYELLLRNTKTRELLEHVDVIVDGRFDKEKSNIDLIFVGSSNQRIIDVKKSLREGVVVELDYKPYPVF